MKLFRSTLATGATFLAVACSQGSSTPAGTQGGAFTVVNPTGNCTADTNGDRAGYHSSEGTVYVPDCKSPRAREYWRVFASDAEHAYTIPRLDGAPGLKPACDDATDPLHALVLKYRLCASASSPEEVEIVNRMAIADALTLTHALHGTLRFTNRDRLAPYAPPTDILDACNLHPTNDAPELAAMCTREQERLESGNDIGYTYEGPGATELARRLNELYDIVASDTLACVSYADGVCDAASGCSLWSMRRVVCAAACPDPGSEVRTSCGRGGTADVLCRAEITTGDLFADMGGGDPADLSEWRACTDKEREAFAAATR